MRDWYNIKCWWGETWSVGADWANASAKVFAKHNGDEDSEIELGQVGDYQHDWQQAMRAYLAYEAHDEETTQELEEAIARVQADELRDEAWKVAKRARDLLLEYATFVENNCEWDGDAADALHIGREIHTAWHRFEDEEKS